MEVKIDSEKAKRIEKYVNDGRFDSVEKFVDHALTLLLYAEDNKDMFQKMLRENPDLHKA